MKNTYGLTFKDLEAVRDKLQRQRVYLEKEEFYSSFSGQVKTLLDVSMSPNHSIRYYSMILNKVSTFISYNIDKDLTPIFLTVTLDGFFRDFLRGDYSRWKKYKDKYKNHIPNNQRFGYYLNQIDIEASKSNPNPLTPKDLYRILSFQFFRFIRSYTLQKLKKEGLEFTFIKVHEPHKDGVPHLHILFYLPSQYIKPLYYHFKNFFPAPRNHQKLNFRDNGRTSERIEDIIETQGFQWKINSPMGYILKYILKSFRNVQNNDDIDYLQAWYIHYKIPRIIFSRTLIPQDVYYKASLFEKDWFYLTWIRDNGKYRRSIQFDFFELIDLQSGRRIYYNSGYFELSYNDKIIKFFGEKPKPKFSTFKPKNYSLIFIKNNRHLLSKNRFLKVQKSKRMIEFLSKHKSFKVIIDNSEYIAIGDDNSIFTIPNFKPVKRLSYQALLEEYINFNFDLYPVERYALIVNECLDRGIPIEIKHKLNITEFSKQLTEFPIKNDKYIKRL